MDYDVVIAGAGPVGSLLACELRLAGVSVLVLEKMPDPNSPLKGGPTGGRGLNIPSIEAFYRRGLLPAVSEAALWWVSPSDVRKLGSEAAKAFQQRPPSNGAPIGQAPAAAPAKSPRHSSATSAESCSMRMWSTADPDSPDTAPPPPEA